jgi:hypothetical protein
MVSRVGMIVVKLRETKRLIKANCIRESTMNVHSDDVRPWNLTAPLELEIFLALFRDTGVIPRGFGRVTA